MSIVHINETFNTQAKCLKHLEKIRWGSRPTCSHCGGKDHITKREKKKSKTTIFHCNECNKDFTVLIGTIFEHNRMPLPKWFMLITLLMDAKKGIASTQVGRNLEMQYRTAWYSTMRLRCAMIEDIELDGVIEADETYIGGKPRKRYKNSTSITSLSQISTEPEPLNIANSKRGRGSSKAKVAGMVERNGKVVLKLMEAFNTTTLLALLKRNVNTSKSLVITDEARFYNKFDDYVQHLVIKHKETFANGTTHTNTIEGFWSILKNGIKGNYRVLSKKYLPFYLAEFAYRYNRRNTPSKLSLDEFLKTAMHESKCMEYYKPLEEPKTIAYKYTPKQKELSKLNEKNSNELLKKKKEKIAIEKAEIKKNKKLLTNKKVA